MHQRRAKYLLGCLVSGGFHPKVWLTAQLSFFFEGVWLQFPLYFTGRWSVCQSSTIQKRYSEYSHSFSSEESDLEVLGVGKKLRLMPAVTSPVRKWSLYPGVLQVS